MASPILASSIQAMQPDAAPSIDQLAAQIIRSTRNARELEGRGQAFSPDPLPEIMAAPQLTANVGYTRPAVERALGVDGTEPKSPTREAIKSALGIKGIAKKVGKNPFALKDLADNVKWSESRGNYKAYNKSTDAMGAYQFTPVRLRELGYMDKNNNWTGKMGISSKEDFLNSPEAQDFIFNEEHIPDLRNKLSGNGALGFAGQEIPELGVITEEGLLKGAHLGGPTGVKRYLESGKDARDNNSTSISDYMFNRR